MVTLLNAATPATAATVTVPLKVPPPGLAPIASVTLSGYVFTGFPSVSRAVTCTAGVIGAPASVESGWRVKSSWAGAPELMAKAALVAPGGPGGGAARREARAHLSLVG